MFTSGLGFDSSVMAAVREQFRVSQLVSCPGFRVGFRRTGFGAVRQRFRVSLVQFRELFASI